MLYRTASAIPINEEIDHTEPGVRRQTPGSEPHGYILNEVSGWRAGNYFDCSRGENEVPDDAMQLVVRREIHQGLDEYLYRHLNFWALYFVRRGHGTHVINGHAWSMARGNVYLLAPNSVHFYRGAADVVLDAVYFGENLFSLDQQQALAELKGAGPLIADRSGEAQKGGEGSSTRPGHFLHLSPERQIEVETSISHIRMELSQRERALHLSAQSRLWCLIVQLAVWRGESPGSMRSGESRELADVLHFCEVHFSRPLTVDQLANMTHFSRNHFARLFTLEVGMAPATFLRHLRLQHAQKLLRETSHTATDIGRLCGFADPTAFSRAFQRSFGISPSVYRRENKRTAKPKAAKRKGF